VAAGKATEAMLPAFARWAGPRLAEIVVAGGAHPLPDRESVRAARRALDLARGSNDQIALVLLLSGGASSMMAMPAEPLALEDKAAATRALLAGGVPIEDINCVRKHLSAVKGGRLASQARASCTFAISDVIGPREDDMSVIGSGPGVADDTTYADAVLVLQSHGLWDAMPQAIQRHLEKGRQGDLEDTPKAGDPRLARAMAYVIGSRRDAMAAARVRAEALGYETHVIADPVLGEAARAGPRVAERGLAIGAGRERVCVISSGETTVRLRGRGRGGRNQELALAAVPILAAAGRRVVLASVGTDGVDGPTDAAGALVDDTTARRAASGGVDVAAALADNDSYHALDRLGTLVRTGPTGTNVGDLQIVLVG
jgi:glycerate-2-kinase